MTFHARKSFTIRDRWDRDVAVVSESPDGETLIIHNLQATGETSTLKLPRHIAESLSDAIAEFHVGWDD